MKRFLSLLLVAIMLLAIVPFSALNVSAEYGVAIDNSNNLAYGKAYITTEPFRQGGVDVDWGYDADAPQAYPDESGYSLTDGYIANDYYDYQEPSWVGYNSQSPSYTQSFGNYVEINLGDVYDIAEVTVYVGTMALGADAGLHVPDQIEFWARVDGGLQKVATVTPQESNDSQIAVTADLSGISTQYVQVSIKSTGWAFISEITVAEDLNPDNGNNNNNNNNNQNSSSAVQATISVPETYSPGDVITAAVTFENVSYEDGIHAFVGNLYYDTDKLAPVFIDVNSDWISALDPYAEWEDMTQWKTDDEGRTCIQLAAMTPGAVDNVITHVYLGETITFYVDFSVLPDATGDINFEITSNGIKAINFFNDDHSILGTGDTATVKPENANNGNNTTVMLGDINQNGKIDMTDYILLKRAYFGTYTFSAAQNKAGDINQNGKIDMTDYILLKRVYFGTYTIQGQNKPATKPQDKPQGVEISKEMIGDWALVTGADTHGLEITNDGKIIYYDVGDALELDYQCITSTKITDGGFTFEYSNGTLVRYKNGKADGYTYKKPGAASLEELKQILSADFCFTEDQIRCMTTPMIHEMLYLTYNQSTDDNQFIYGILGYETDDISKELNDLIVNTGSARLMLHVGTLYETNVDSYDVFVPELQNDALNARIQAEHSAVEGIWKLTYTAEDDEGMSLIIYADDYEYGDTRDFYIYKINGRYFWSFLDLYLW